jgi:hypothetical protein
MRLKSSSGGEKGSYEERLETGLDSFHYTGISVSPVELIWVFNGLELMQDTTKSVMLYNQRSREISNSFDAKSNYISQLIRTQSEYYIDTIYRKHNWRSLNKMLG